MRYLLILTFLLLNVPAHATDLASREWTTSGLKPLPIEKEVATLLKEVLDSSWTMPVCSFTFIDPDKTGILYLLVSVDVNGRSSCNRLVVIGRSGKNLKVLNDWQVFNVGDVARITHDLNNDEKVELVVPRGWSKYETGHCMAIWQTVYHWKDGHFTDQSAAYPDMYKQRKQQLETRVTEKKDPSCDQMEMDKISRLLGTPKAGFDRAEGWMKSPTANLRRKAATVFADINDADSKKNLAFLADDSDVLVAETARIYLEFSDHPKE